MTLSQCFPIQTVINTTLLIEALTCLFFKIPNDVSTNILTQLAENNNDLSMVERFVERLKIHALKNK